MCQPQSPLERAVLRRQPAIRQLGAAVSICALNRLAQTPPSKSALRKCPAIRQLGVVTGKVRTRSLWKQQ